MNEDINYYLAENQKQMDVIVERLETLEQVAKQTQDAFSSIERRLAKTEKKLNEIGAVKIYRDIIRKDLKELSKEVKATQRELFDSTKKIRKNRSELKALTKLLRIQLQRNGIYFGKRASLKKICTSLMHYPWSSPKLGKENIDEL